MATYDLEEQESLAELKAWWSRWGDLITWIAFAALLVVAGSLGWKQYRIYQAASAGAVFDSLQSAAEKQDEAKVRELAGMILEQYPRTQYASLAAFVAARLAQEKGDNKNAKLRLQWVIDNSGTPAFVDIAGLRLSAMLLDEKDYAAAMARVAKAGTAPFAPRFADARGDILYAQKKNKEALAAYKEALAATKDEPEQRGFRRMLEVKIAELGGSSQ